MPYELSPCRKNLFRRLKSPRRCLSPHSKAGKKELRRLSRSPNLSEEFAFRNWNQFSSSPARRASSPLENCPPHLFRRETKPRRCLSPHSRSGREEILRRSKSPSHRQTVVSFASSPMVVAQSEPEVVYGPVNNPQFVSVASSQNSVVPSLGAAGMFIEAKDGPLDKSEEQMYAEYKAHKANRKGANGWGGIFFGTENWSENNPVSWEEFKAIKAKNLKVIADVINKREQIDTMPRVLNYLKDDFGVVLTNADFNALQLTKSWLQN
jgi:hypothetical protein